MNKKLLKKSVVITGLGVVAPNGIGKKEFVTSLKEGIVGIDKISLFSPEGLPSKIAGEVKDFTPTDFVSKKEVQRIGRGACLGIAAAELALKDRGEKLSSEEKKICPVIIGTSLGGLDFAEREFKKFFNFGYTKISSYCGVAVFCATISAEISKHLSINGKSISISNGCTSAIDAMSYAANEIKSGVSDVAICGGADACVTPGIIAAFAKMKVLSTKYNDYPKIACKPFDRDRDGFVIGEGAWMFILESYEKAKKRKAKIYAEVCGSGSTCDAFHSTHPDPSGKYTAESIFMALKGSGVNLKDIDYIAAYGNGTRVNDPYETMVIKKVFGKYAYNIPISSVKSMIGHSIGASGAAQVATAALSIHENFIPPTMNMKNPDVQCDLDYVPDRSRSKRVNKVLCNTLSFGGKNAAIVIGRINNDI